MTTDVAVVAAERVERCETADGELGAAAPSLPRALVPPPSSSMASLLGGAGERAPAVSATAPP